MYSPQPNSFHINILLSSVLKQPFLASVKAFLVLDFNKSMPISDLFGTGIKFVLKT